MQKIKILKFDDKLFLFGLFCCYFFVCSSLFGLTKDRIEFVIVIPSYNNEKWVIENLQSACFQKSSLPYEVIFINDCSTDKTGELAEAYIRDNKLGSQVRIIHNQANKGVLANWYEAIHSLPDYKIVVNLDGDDQLAHNEVLMKLEEYYKDPNIWLTYGSFQTWPSRKRMKKISGELPHSFFVRKRIRKHRFITSHLRTFKAGLFKKINKNDLLYKGKFFKAAVDVAFMIPMLEMCCPKNKSSKKHAQFIPDILYFYRTNNSSSISKKRRNEQFRISRYIRRKKSYSPIISL